MKFFTDYETQYRYVRLSAEGDKELIDYKHFGFIAKLKPNVVEWLSEHAPNYTLETYGSAIIIDFFDDDAALHFKLVFR